MYKLPFGVKIFSFQWWTTSSQVISVRIRYNVGILGLFEESMNPRCLKETISPGCGFHLFANSVVPAGATNRTPFGLLWYCGQFPQSLLWFVTYNSHSHMLSLSDETIFASLSRYFFSILKKACEWCKICRDAKYLISNQLTLCLRNPFDRPVSKGLTGSRKMIPSPPWSMISWNIFSRWSVPSHNLYGAIWMNRWFFPLSAASIFEVRGDNHSGGRRNEYVIVDIVLDNFLWMWEYQTPWIGMNSSQFYHDPSCVQSSLILESCPSQT